MSNYQPLITNQVVAPNGTYSLAIDRLHFKQPFLLMLTESYAQTSNTTGLALTIFDGMGNPSLATVNVGGVPIIISPSDPAITYNTTGTKYTDLVTAATPSSGSPVTASISGVFIVGGSSNACSRFIKLTFTNKDASFPCTLTVQGDF